MLKLVTLVIFHYHFRPGGVRRVIELATPHLVEFAPERIARVVLVSGEAPEPAWRRDFQGRLRGTPIEVVVHPAFGYASELTQTRRALAAAVKAGVIEFLQACGGGTIVWAHNLGLGRNFPLARELTRLCHLSATPLLVHHHDWWFENRWPHYADMRRAGARTLREIATTLLAASPWVAHAAINQADATVLERHFRGHAGWLPNPVEPLPPAPPARARAARSWLDRTLGDTAPVWLLPCRLLRRKNIAEALLLTRWLRPGAWLVTTAGVSSAAETAYATALDRAARAHGWRLRLAVLAGGAADQPTVPELYAASEAVVLTSLQEGFGLPYLEAAAARRPLLARQLPNIAPDLAKFGFQFPQSYRDILIAPGLFDWPRERARQAQLFAAWRRQMPRPVQRLVCAPEILAAGRDPVPLPFSRLTLAAQIEVLALTPESSWARCAPLNPFLVAWREAAGSSALRISAWPLSAGRWLDGRAYARRFFELVPNGDTPGPSSPASLAAQTALLAQKLTPANLYPLLWQSET